MTVASLPLLDMLKTRMGWLQERQKVLAQNVAQADTPGYRARDLAPLDFKSHLQPPARVAGLAVTNPAHLVGARDGSAFGVTRARTSEVRPSGNAVELEDEMMKVAQNQIDYQTATSLYSRSLGLIKTAIGKAR